MLPIRDDIRSKSFPIANWLIILANVLVFLFQIGISQSQMDWVVLHYSFIPAKFNLLNPFTYLPVLTSMFMHGSWFHLLSNMWFLAIFGDNVEDRLGSGRYLLFYILGGAAAALLQFFVDPSSTVPVVGASGAIAAVMGAYLLFFPKARVLTLVPLPILAWFIRVPAVIFLGVWFVTNFFSGLQMMVTPSGAQVGGVAWWAHVGGFLFGMLAASIFDRKNRKISVNQNEYYPW